MVQMTSGSSYGFLRSTAESNTTDNTIEVRPDRVFDSRAEVFSTHCGIHDFTYLQKHESTSSLSRLFAYDQDPRSRRNDAHELIWLVRMNTEYCTKTRNNKGNRDRPGIEKEVESSMEKYVLGANVEEKKNY